MPADAPTTIATLPFSLSIPLLLVCTVVPHPLIPCGSGEQTQARRGKGARVSAPDPHGREEAGDERPAS
jgi:hypothetical protein